MLVIMVIEYSCSLYGDSLIARTLNFPGDKVMNVYLQKLCSPEHFLIHSMVFQICFNCKCYTELWNAGPSCKL